VLSLLVVLWAGRTPGEAKERGRIILNPTTYASPSGEIKLLVDPSTMYGQGEGTYRLTRAGHEVWAGKLPFTLWKACVTDDGVVAGYVYSLGIANQKLKDDAGQEGCLHLVILEPDGRVRLDDVLSRSGSVTCTSVVHRNVRGILADPESDRFIARLQEEGLPTGSERWRTYRLSTGGLVSDFVLASPAAGEHEVWTVLAAQLVRGTPLVLLDWKYTKWDRGGNKLRAWGGYFTLVDADGKPVWTLDLPQDYPEYSDYDKRLHGKKDEAERERLSQLADEIEQGGAILKPDGPGRFAVRGVRASERVTFEVRPDRDARGGWRVAEVARAAYVSAQPAETPLFRPPPLKLERIGSLPVGPKSERAREIRKRMQPQPLLDGKAVYAQPATRRAWVATREDITLVDADGQIVSKTARRPDGNWLERIECAAVAPDGTLAVAVGPSNLPPPWVPAEERIILYGARGEPARSIRVPNVKGLRYGVQRLESNGRYLVVQIAENLMLLDTAADALPWSDLSVNFPEGGYGRYGLNPEGTELWIAGKSAAQIERFRLP
jgi:hypothetical protein